MHLSINALSQIAAYAVPHSPCTIPCAHLTYHCCAAPPQQMQKPCMLRCLEDWLLSLKCFSFYSFPGVLVRRRTTLRKQGCITRKMHFRLSRLLATKPTVSPQTCRAAGRAVFYLPHSAPPKAGGWQPTLTSGGACYLPVTRRCDSRRMRTCHPLRRSRAAAKTKPLHDFQRVPTPSAKTRMHLPIRSQRYTLQIF